MRPAREIRRSTKGVLKLAARLRDAARIDTQDFWIHHGFTRLNAAEKKLERIPIDSLLPVAGSEARLAALKAVGVANLKDAMLLPGYRLRRAVGVGHKTAAEVKAAATEVFNQLSFATNATFFPDERDSDQTKLLEIVARAVEVDRATRGLGEPVREFAKRAPALLKRARAETNAVVRLFAGQHRRLRAREALAELDQELSALDARDIPARLDARLREVRVGAFRGEAAWDAFAASPQEFYAAMDQIGRPVLSVDPESALPEDLVNAVVAQRLDTSMLTARLRRYQEFGARFALHQRRVILGDEMGLGKTIQAIAVLAHAASAEGASRFLVVVPASVLINWEREVSAHSALETVRLHGADRDAALADWEERGGVAITTFATLRALKLPETVVPDVLVVDEAHYVKNSVAQRTKAVASLAARTDRVLFMTGTPMENRVSEFTALVRMLQPEVAANFRGYAAVGGAQTFRLAVAPVYLRRNQSEVLSELPELIQVDEWEALTAREWTHYRNQVRQGGFMAMRQATFGLDAAPSSKLERLVELCEEAAASGEKVLVFSYFRAVISAVAEALGTAVHGPITGDVSPSQRQRIVDGFTAADAPAVLVSQIQAGGVGLNLQSASLVILCEPQIKPTLESQAVARAHRMGQLRRVQVHRLLAAESIDETMVEMLGLKQALFDAYARPSALSSAASAEQGLDDGTETGLAARIVAAEQARLEAQESGGATGAAGAAPTG